MANSLVAGQSQIAKFMGPTWDPSGSCRPQMGPMLAPWTLLSGVIRVSHCQLSYPKDYGLTHATPSADNLTTSEDTEQNRGIWYGIYHTTASQPSTQIILKPVTIMFYRESITTICHSIQNCIISRVDSNHIYVISLNESIFYVSTTYTLNLVIILFHVHWS